MTDPRPLGDPERSDEVHNPTYYDGRTENALTTGLTHMTWLTPQSPTRTGNQNV